ncbi:MAG: hypothetical protein WAT39_20915 [Planctomycetota bacterium]
MTTFADVLRALAAARVRFLISGVWGVNYYVVGPMFATRDQDLFLPRDAENLLNAWRACEQLGLALTANDEPLDQPRDEVLAAAVVRTRSLTSASDGGLLHVDFSLVMGDFDFDTIWPRRRSFLTEGASSPVASLADILAAKRTADRPKDRLFLATHAEQLRKLLGQG